MDSSTHGSLSPKTCDRQVNWVALSIYDPPLFSLTILKLLVNSAFDKRWLYSCMITRKSVITAPLNASSVRFWTQAITKPTTLCSPIGKHHSPDSDSPRWLSEFILTSSLLKWHSTDIMGPVRRGLSQHQSPKIQWFSIRERLALWAPIPMQNVVKVDHTMKSLMSRPILNVSDETPVLYKSFCTMVKITNVRVWICT